MHADRMAVTIQPTKLFRMRLKTSTTGAILGKN